MRWSWLRPDRRSSTVWLPLPIGFVPCTDHVARSGGHDDGCTRAVLGRDGRGMPPKVNDASASREPGDREARAGGRARGAERGDLRARPTGRDRCAGPAREVVARTGGEAGRVSAGQIVVAARHVVQGGPDAAVGRELTQLRCELADGRGARGVHVGDDRRDLGRGDARARRSRATRRWSGRSRRCRRWPRRRGPARHDASEHDPTPDAGCHAGRVNTADSPPPAAPSFPPRLLSQVAKFGWPWQSFQTGSTPAPSRSVPPTPVMFGSSAGVSTASAEEPLPLAKQSAEPLSPVAATTVWPCATACASRMSSAELNVGSDDGSHRPQLVETASAVSSKTIFWYTSYSPCAVFGPSYDTMRHVGSLGRRFLDVDVRLEGAARVDGSPAVELDRGDRVVQPEAGEVRGRVRGGVRRQLDDRDLLAGARLSLGQQPADAVERADLVRCLEAAARGAALVAAAHGVSPSACGTACGRAAVARGVVS